MVIALGFVMAGLADDAGPVVGFFLLLLSAHVAFWRVRWSELVPGEAVGTAWVLTASAVLAAAGAFLLLAG